MAATSILSTDDEMNAMAGENVDVTGWTDANKTAWGKQAESFLTIHSKYNWQDTFAGLNADVKQILSEYVARYTGASGIAYNMSGFGSRIVAEDMLNVHFKRMNDIEKKLGDKDFINWIKKGATN